MPIADRLVAEHDRTTAHLKAFDGVKDNAADFVAAMNALTQDPDKLVSSRSLAKEIQDIARALSDEEQALTALVIAADIAMHGFGIGEVHLRINATQLRNAMRLVDGRAISLSDGVNSQRLLIDRLAKRIST